MRRASALALLLLASAAAPAGADETLGQVADPTPVDAWNARQVWSERDPATRRFRLMTRAIGAASAVPVPERATPFDVDLGPDASRSTVVAYSRHGELFAFDFASGRERSLGLRGRLPSIWRGTVAWVRGGRLFVRPLAGGAAREVRGGRGTYIALDLNGRRLAFVREHPHGDGREYEMLLRRGRGEARVVDRSASGALSIVEMMRPSIRGGGLYYAVARRLAAGQRFLHYEIASRRLQQVVSHPRILGAAFDRGRFFYVQAPSEGEGDNGCVDSNLSPAPCLLRLSDPVTF
jgi:hypothetical protein